MITNFSEDRCVRHLFVDALDRPAVSVSGDENYRYLAYGTKPSRDLDPFAASFEVDIHQDNIWLVAHCEP